MSAWILAAIILFAALAGPLLVCVTRPIVDALIALELAGTITTVIFIVLAEGYHRQPFIDLALLFALLSMIGAMAFARLMEREL